MTKTKLATDGPNIRPAASKGAKRTRSAAKPPAPPAEQPDNAHDSRQREEVFADNGLSTATLNSITSMNAICRKTAPVDVTTERIVAFTDVMAAKIKAVNGGDMSGPEAMLVAQSVALDCLFTDLVQRAQANFAEYLPAAETYMRLALKAQAQCRANIEALGELKNPRSVAFIKQANVAAGDQQVNNGTAPPSARSEHTARGETDFGSNELLLRSDG